MKDLVKLQIWYGFLIFSMGILSNNQVLAVEAQVTDTVAADESFLLKKEKERKITIV